MHIIQLQKIIDTFFYTFINIQYHDTLKNIKYIYTGLYVVYYGLAIKIIYGF